MSADLAADVRRLVLGAAATSDLERAAQADFATFFPDEHGPVSRDDGPDHATASALVFDPTLTRTLLVFHAKGQFWVQPGGHLESGDASIADAALRELREETGVVVSGLPESLVYDLDHHGLSSAFGRCSSHLDIGVAVVVPEGAALIVSDESEDVRWWPIDALPDQVPPGFDGRVRRLRDRLLV
ncbi:MULTISPECIES: NUDIX hydrolase [Microbacterium]|uniref:NUDIX hydrolase n=1 Tax=Microbacterium TaxID=33882 RepID=UPI000ABAFCAA|nr:MULTISPECIES: NUDIX domain-containing protein [Microbacterium]